MKILWICHVWPEPMSSAAGVRTMQLIEACRSAGHEVVASSGCQTNTHRARLETGGIKTFQFEPNDIKFDSFIAEMDPQIVFFDRFMVEEQFSWRVREQCPDALRVLDSIDLHSLRRQREQKVRRGDFNLDLKDPELQSDDAVRELSSIFRSDLSLIISDYEQELLIQRYHVPDNLLALVRPSITGAKSGPAFEQRSNFVTIGNFNHSPNSDSYHLLQQNLWPEIRKALENLDIKDAELHVFGAYPSKALMDLDNPASGFRVMGWTPDARATLEKYRVNLAPLRFGAGIKGKILEGWSVGTPCMATPVAAEGMQYKTNFGGLIETDLARFAEQAARLYTSSQLWRECQEHGRSILGAIFDQDKNEAYFLERLIAAKQNQTERRERNFVGAMLWHHQHRSTEFFSRWIEAKNSLLAKAS